MKILFLSDNFPPEINAPATRTYEHAVEWVRAGHQVTVITTAPNFPEGRLFGGYRNRLAHSETMDGIEVIRVKTYITANEGFLKRTLDYVSFMFTGGLAALFHPRPDVIVTTSPQFFCAMAGWVVTRLRRLPWVFELRDLWPASIVAVGAMKKSRAIRLLEWIELRMYRDADAVVSVTHAFKTDLVRRGIDPAKIHVVLNGVDLSLYRPMPKDEALLDQFDLRGKFVVGYLGTHGMAHALDKVVDAATILRDHPDIVFLFGRRSQTGRTGGDGQGSQAHECASDPSQPKAHDAAAVEYPRSRADPAAEPGIVRHGYPFETFRGHGDGSSGVDERSRGRGHEPGAGDGLRCAGPSRRSAGDGGRDPSFEGESGRAFAIPRIRLAAAPQYTRDKQAIQMLHVLEKACWEDRSPS